LPDIKWLPVAELLNKPLVLVAKEIGLEKKFTSAAEPGV
jgi:hypothetical protein